MKIGVVCLSLLVLGAGSLWAHCQIPCGIYGDETRFDLLEEHVRTIEKSMVQIRALQGKVDESNQLVRWVMNKEAHAEKIIDIVTDYFLAQRIKPLTGRVDRRTRMQYQSELVACHEIIVQAMKAKQGIDEARVRELRTLVARLEGLYLARTRAVKAHGHSHHHPRKGGR